MHLLTFAFLQCAIALSLAQDSNDTYVDPCAADDGGGGEYDLGLHIAGLFILMAVSGIGVLGAIILGSTKRLAKNKNILFTIQVFKFFGVGIIAATAWIHILPDAFEIFSSPCLASAGGWGVYGTNFVGLFGLIASFMVQGIEFSVIVRHERISNKKKQRQKEMNEVEMKKPINKDKQQEQHVASHSHSSHSSHSHHDDKDVDNEDPCTHGDHEHNVGTLHDIAGHSHSISHAITEDNPDVHKDIATLSLELGILVHSVIIGVALGVATTEWQSLFIAICFHQFFEGIALGTRIAELKHVKELSKKLGVGMAYPITTPVGIAIGIGVHYSYAPTSFAALLAQGIMNSLAAGILIYNTYVELIALEINQSSEFRAAKPKLKAASFLAMYTGAGVMAVLAIWA